MNNDKWIKQKDMGDNETNLALLRQRVDEHEDKLDKLEKAMNDIHELKTNVAILVNRFANFAPNNCTIHQLKIDALEKRLEKTESVLDGITKKIIGWSAVGSFVLYVMSQVLLPYFIKH